MGLHWETSALLIVQVQIPLISHSVYHLLDSTPQLGQDNCHLPPTPSLSEKDSSSVNVVCVCAGCVGNGSGWQWGYNVWYQLRYRHGWGNIMQCVYFSLCVERKQCANQCINARCNFLQRMDKMLCLYIIALMISFAQGWGRWPSG